MVWSNTLCFGGRSPFCLWCILVFCVVTFTHFALFWMRSEWASLCGLHLVLFCNLSNDIDFLLLLSPSSFFLNLNRLTDWLCDSDCSDTFGSRPLLLRSTSFPLFQRDRICWLSPPLLIYELYTTIGWWVWVRIVSISFYFQIHLILCMVFAWF